MTPDTAPQVPTVPPQAAPVSAYAGNREAYWKERHRYIRNGILWFFAPAIMLIVVLTMYAVMGFVMGAGGSREGAPIFRSLVGLLRLIAVLSVFVGFVMGIINLCKRPSDVGLPYDERSGKGPASQVPPEIMGWNW